MGYYEIVGAIENTSHAERFLALRSVTNQHHITGIRSWFNVGSDDDTSFTCDFTLHRSVSQILSDRNALIHEIESARVKALIGPNLNSNTELVSSTWDSTSLVRGNSCTWVDGSPSNLSELGFGVAVYPAKLSHDSSALVADFNNPLSPDLYEVDYEGATVYLKNSYTQDTTITNHSTNPSKRTVLFISCVALSQEASFGTRLIADGKGAFSPVKVPQILTSDSKSISELDDPDTFGQQEQTLSLPLTFQLMKFRVWVLSMQIFQSSTPLP